MTEQKAAPYLGQYWVSNLTEFRFDLSLIIGQLSFQAPSQSRFLLYPMNDSTFGTVHGIKAVFGFDDRGEVTYMRVDQGPNRGTLLANPVKEPVANLFQAFLDEDFEQAQALVPTALAAAPQDSFVPLMEKHLQYRSTPAFAQQQEQYSRFNGIYVRDGQEFRIITRDGNLFFEQINNGQGFDPFRLYPFKPGHFFILENVQAYLRLSPNQLLFHYFGKKQEIVADRLRDLP